MSRPREARGVLAVANDRSLDVDAYVYQVKISRKTAEAIIAVRNGTNGVNESRPIFECNGSSGPVGSSSGSSGGGGSSGWSGSGGSVPPPPPVPTTSGFPLPPPYPPTHCTVTWQLGGDDERFSLLRELDALPGTDVAAFKNMRQFAIQHGYVRPTPPTPSFSVTATPPPSPPPSVTTTGPTPPPPPSRDAGAAPF